MSSEVAIRVENISKHYQVYDKPHQRLLQMFAGSRKQYFRDFCALQDISFTVQRGETVGVIGRNGSGKSTLLQIICGTLTPSTGRVQVNGRVAALLELGAGFNPEFTGRENVYLSASLYGLKQAEIETRMTEIIVFAELEGFMDQPVKTYSSGMFVRLAFAVIAHVDADILIIDEALAVGDVFFTQKCMRFLKRFRRNGTILFVTHDTNSVIGLCDRAIWLNQSRMMQMNTAKTVCEAYLEELYAATSSRADKDAAEKTATFSPVSDFRDVRQDFVNQSTLRNDLEIFRFAESAEHFGTGLVQIRDAYLSVSGNPEAVAWFVGGEVVQLHVVAQAKVDLQRPIVGFLVKNRLGQNLFGDNTFLNYANKPVMFREGEYFSALFRFRMPLMPSGDYTIGIAVADGSQENHVVHQWMHDAIAFKAHSDSVATGLLGIPMLAIELRAYEQPV